MMSFRPRVLLDVDGPLTDGFAAETCRMLREIGYDARPELIDEWDIMDSFGVSPEHRWLVARELRRPGVAGVGGSFRPRPGAQEFLEELRHSCDVVAVTAPLEGSRTWAYDRATWLGVHLGFDAARIVSAADKSLVGGEAFVDDKPSAVEAWDRENAGTTVLWGTRYNRHFEWDNRASNYEALRHVLRHVVMR